MSSATDQRPDYISATRQHAEIKKRAAETRSGFMTSTIALDQGQLLNLIQMLGEEKAEDESRSGQVVTQRCIDFAIQVGRFKYADTFETAILERFNGTTDIDLVFQERPRPEPIGGLALFGRLIRQAVTQ